MSSKRGNQRRHAKPAPKKQLTKEEAIAEEEAFQKRVSESIARDREKAKYWGVEQAFFDSGCNTY